MHLSPKVAYDSRDFLSMTSQNDLISPTIMSYPSKSNCWTEDSSSELILLCQHPTVWAPG